MRTLISQTILIASLLSTIPAYAATPTHLGQPVGAAGNFLKASVSDQNRLLVMVRLPNDQNHTWTSDDTSARFAGLVVRALHAQGFNGEIGTLGPEDKAPPGTAILYINLVSWTAGKGIANCSFSASLRSNNGYRNLGAFAGDNVVDTADGEHRYSHEGLVGAAQEAMTGLNSQLQTIGLVAAQ